MLLRSKRTRAGGGGGVSPAGTQHRARLGVNVPNTNYYSRYYGMKNILNGGSGYFDADYHAQVPAVPQATIGTDGWPTSDFGIAPYCGPVRAPATVTCQFTGKAAVSVVTGGAASALSAVSYNSGTNTSTFTFIYDNSGGNVPPYFYFQNTQKTNVSATNTGVSNLLMWWPEDVGAGANEWRPEFISSMSDFEILRTMDMQGTNNNPNTLDWSARSTFDPMHTIAPDPIIAMANQAGKDLWFCIPINATDDYIDNLATYALANFTGAHLDLELGNENWNTFFQTNKGAINNASIELRAAMFGFQRGITSVVRASNVVTVTTNFAHGLSVGENIHAAVDDNLFTTGAYVVASTPTSTTFTFSSSGSNGTSSLGPNSEYLSLDAAATSTLYTFSGWVGLYAYGMRWAARRTAQISDRVRAIVGDSLMMTKFRPILGEQISGGVLSYVPFLDWVVGGIANTKTKIYAVAGAPYFSNVALYTNTGESTPAHTVTEYANDLALGAENIKWNGMGLRASGAIQRGIKYVCYEGGPDTGFDPGTANGNRVNVNDARITATVGAGYSDLLKHVSSVGFDSYNHYHGGLDDQHSTSFFCWGFTYSYSVVTGMWQALKDYIALADSAMPTVNLISSVVGTPVAVDARYTAGANLVDAPSGSYVNLAQEYVDWLITAPADGVYACVLEYSTNDAQWTGSIGVSNPWGKVEVNEFDLQQPHVDYPLTGGLATFASTAPFNLTLKQGVNVMRFTAHWGHFGISTLELFRTLTFTRVS